MATFIPTGSRCLNVGRNEGAMGPWLLGHGCSYVGVDASQATALPFDKGSFDTALLVDVLDQLVKPQLAMRELCRVLRPGGVLLVAAPNFSYWRRRLDRVLAGNDPQAGSFSPGSMRSLLLQSGFSLVGVEGQDGAIVRDLPLAGRLWKGQSSAPYRVAERLFPSLLGSQVRAFAIRV
jgi:SAM-dependent methyltransferase